jgi:hypothetical protein
LKRLLLVAVLAAATAVTVVPASATPLGRCGGKVDALCMRGGCPDPEHQCTPMPCAVYLNYTCEI